MLALRWRWKKSWVGTLSATQEEQIRTIHRNLELDVGSNLPGYRITADDCYLDRVYGDHMHANDSTHLDGRIRDEITW